MQESPGPPALSEFLEAGVGVGGCWADRVNRKKRPRAHGVQGNPRSALSGLRTRVGAAQLQMCPGEFPELGGGPRQVYEEHPREGRPGTGRKSRAGVATDPGLACEARKGTRVGLWLDETETSETMSHEVLRPFQFLELGHFC